MEDIQTLGDRGHHAVLDAVVHHFDEVARTVWTTIQVALFSGTGGTVAARRARRRSQSGGQCGEDRFQTRKHFLFAADHLAVTSL